jgi:hypothetical protein
VVGDILNEFCCLLRRNAGNGSDLDPLGEFIHHHEDVSVAAKAILKGPTESRPHMAKG